MQGTIEIVAQRLESTCINALKTSVYLLTLPLYIGAGLLNIVGTNSHTDVFLPAGPNDRLLLLATSLTCGLEKQRKEISWKKKACLAVCVRLVRKHGSKVYFKFSNGRTDPSTPLQFTQTPFRMSLVLTLLSGGTRKVSSSYLQCCCILSRRPWPWPAATEVRPSFLSAFKMISHPAPHITFNPMTMVHTSNRSTTHSYDIHVQVPTHVVPNEANKIQYAYGHAYKQRLVFHLTSKLRIRHCYHY